MQEWIISFNYLLECFYSCGGISKCLILGYLNIANFVRN
jgi:hypothetical protein